MKRFLRYASRHKTLYIFSAVMMGLGIAFDAFIPTFIQSLVDDVLEGGQTALMWTLLLEMLGCFIMRGLTKYAQELASDIVGWKVVLDARNDLFGFVVAQDQNFFRENTPGELMSRIKSDTESVGMAMGFIGLFMLEIIIHVIVMLVCLIRISFTLALVCIVLMPVMALLSLRSEKKGDKIFGDLSEETATMNKTAGEAISGVRTVKAFNKEEHEKRRFEKRNKHFYNLSVGLEYMFTNYESVVSFLGRLMLTLSVLVGGFMVMRGSMSLGNLAESISYVNNLAWPMMEIGWVVNEIASASASAKKIGKLFSYKTGLHEGKLSRKVKKGTLEFRNVGLKIGETTVLDDVSFTLGEGKTLGIMGATGSGKTTITNLAMRFLDPTSGTILLDGTPLAEMDFKSIRDAYAIVTQDIFLFSETVMENIKIGSPQLTDEQAIEAAKMAKADPFITKLEEGYDTVIGEKGIGLSGGQKQRLCIARALAKDAPILILDDSTSALDMETEKEIQRELSALQETRSSIVVAHRISAVRRADEIIYLEKGRIVERGTHESLMALKGRYYDTFVAQYSKEEADGRQ